MGTRRGRVDLDSIVGGCCAVVDDRGHAAVGGGAGDGGAEVLVGGAYRDVCGVAAVD